MALCGRDKSQNVHHQRTVNQISLLAVQSIVCLLVFGCTLAANVAGHAVLHPGAVSCRQSRHGVCEEESQDIYNPNYQGTSLLHPDARKPIREGGQAIGSVRHHAGPARNGRHLRTAALHGDVVLAEHAADAAASFQPPGLGVEPGASSEAQGSSRRVEAADHTQTQPGGKPQEASVPAPATPGVDAVPKVVVPERGEQGDDDRRNFADRKAGAKVLMSNPEAVKPDRLLGEESYTFMKNECKADKWLVVELSERIRIDSIQIAMLELYSSRVRDFSVYGRTTSPKGEANMRSSLEWILLAHLRAQNKKGWQEFSIPQAWVRYLLFEFKTHYGNENVCAMNNLLVHGITEAEDLERVLSALEQEALGAKTAPKAAAGTSPPEPQSTAVPTADAAGPPHADEATAAPSTPASDSTAQNTIQAVVPHVPPDALEKEDSLKRDSKRADGAAEPDSGAKPAGHPAKPAPAQTPREDGHDSANPVQDVDAPAHTSRQQHPTGDGSLAMSADAVQSASAAREELKPDVDAPATEDPPNGKGGVKPGAGIDMDPYLSAPNVGMHTLNGAVPAPGPEAQHSRSDAHDAASAHISSAAQAKPQGLNQGAAGTLLSAAAAADRARQLAAEGGALQPDIPTDAAAHFSNPPPPDGASDRERSDSTTDTGARPVEHTVQAQAGASDVAANGRVSGQASDSTGKDASETHVLPDKSANNQTREGMGRVQATQEPSSAEPVDDEPFAVEIPSASAPLKSSATTLAGDTQAPAGKPPPPTIPNAPVGDTPAASTHDSASTDAATPSQAASEARATADHSHAKPATLSVDQASADALPPHLSLDIASVRSGSVYDLIKRELVSLRVDSASVAKAVQALEVRLDRRGGLEDNLDRVEQLQGQLEAALAAQARLQTTFAHMEGDAKELRRLLVASETRQMIYLAALALVLLVVGIRVYSPRPAPAPANSRAAASRTSSTRSSSLQGPNDGLWRTLSDTGRRPWPMPPHSACASRELSLNKDACPACGGSYRGALQLRRLSSGGTVPLRATHPSLHALTNDSQTRLFATWCGVGPPAATAPHPAQGASTCTHLTTPTAAAEPAHAAACSAPCARRPNIHHAASRCVESAFGRQSATVSGRSSMHSHAPRSSSPPGSSMPPFDAALFGGPPPPPGSGTTASADSSRCSPPLSLESMPSDSRMNSAEYDVRAHLVPIITDAGVHSSPDSLARSGAAKAGCRSPASNLSAERLALCAEPLSEGGGAATESRSCGGTPRSRSLHGRAPSANVTARPSMLRNTQGCGVQGCALQGDAPSSRPLPAGGIGPDAGRGDGNDKAERQRGCQSSLGQGAGWHPVLLGGALAALALSMGAYYCAQSVLIGQ